MKKVFCLALVLISIFIFAGCMQRDTLVIKESDTYIVISASNEQMPISKDTTLLDYMRSLKDDGDLAFEVTNGMVSSVNGISNASDWSSCWMLYTSDVDSANNAWGTIEYNGNVYGSAMLGAESLSVKEGCLYIWVFQSF